jgi:putative flippase GtrA
MIQLFKYTFISSLALIIDLISFQLLFLTNRLSVPVMSTLSYCTGLVCAYFIFVNSIYERAKDSKKQKLQILLFGFSGIIGTASTFLMSTILNNFFEAGRWQSKIGAIFCSFFLVYWYRKKYVFPKSK